MISNNSTYFESWSYLIWIFLSQAWILFAYQHQLWVDSINYDLLDGMFHFQISVLQRLVLFSKQLVSAKCCGQYCGQYNIYAPFEDLFFLPTQMEAHWYKRQPVEKLLMWRFMCLANQVSWFDSYIWCWVNQQRVCRRCIYPRWFCRCCHWQQWCIPDYIILWILSTFFQPHRQWKS